MSYRLYLEMEMGYMQAVHTSHTGSLFILAVLHPLFGNVKHPRSGGCRQTKKRRDLPF